MWLLITPFVFMFCLTCFRKSWAVIDQSKHLCCVCNSHVKQTWSNLCGTKSGTLSVWSIRSLLEGLSERRNCSHMLSSCSEGMKNCDNGSAYLQTLDTIFFFETLQYHWTRWRSSKIKAPKQSGNRTICKTANRFWIVAFCW